MSDLQRIGEAVVKLLDNQRILRAWKCFDGGYMVSVHPNEYWASSLAEALDKAAKETDS